MTEMESVKNAQRLSHILQGNVVRCLEIIGDAANHVSAEICVANPEIPWVSIIGMRNNLIHGYTEVNYRLVWRTVQNDLKAQEARIPQIISGLDMPSDFNLTYR